MIITRKQKTGNGEMIGDGSSCEIKKLFTVFSGFVQFSVLYCAHDIEQRKRKTGYQNH